MWQTLSIISVVVLGISAIFGVKNREGFEKQVTERKSLQSSIAETERVIGGLNEDVSQLKEETTQLTERAEERRGEKEALLEEETKLKDELKALLLEIEAKEADLNEYKTKMAALPDPELLGKELETKRKRINNLESSVSDYESQLANLNEESSGLKTKLALNEKLETSRRERVSLDTLDAKISASYQDFGFVIVDAGFKQYVIPESRLEVFRDGEPIAKLVVTSTEANQSSADIMMETLQPGLRLRAGDKIKSIIPIAKVTPDAEPSDFNEGLPAAEEESTEPEPADAFDF